MGSTPLLKLCGGTWRLAAAARVAVAVVVVVANANAVLLARRTEHPAHGQTDGRRRVLHRHITPLGTRSAACFVAGWSSKRRVVVVVVVERLSFSRARATATPQASVMHTTRSTYY